MERVTFWRVIASVAIFFVTYESIRLIGELPAHPDEPYTAGQAAWAVFMFVAMFFIGFKVRDEI